MLNDVAAFVSAPPNRLSGGSSMRARGNSAVLVLRRALATMAMATAAAVVVVPHSLAQQPIPKAQPKVEPKAQPKVQQKSAPPPAQQPQQGEQPQITYSPWTKVCPKGPEANAKRICFTGKDGRVEGDRKSTRLNSSHMSISY